MIFMELDTTTRADLIRVAHMLADAARPETLRLFRSADLIAHDKGALAFDPVTQADRAAEQAPGLGEHLAVAHAAVEQQRAVVELDGRGVAQIAGRAVAFGFGLLHGFGFASGLSTVGMPRAEIPLALAMFNVGVELGQILVLLIGVPLVRLSKYDLSTSPILPGVMTMTRPEKKMTALSLRFGAMPRRCR